MPRDRDCDSIIRENPIVEFLEKNGAHLYRYGENFVTGFCPVAQHKKLGHHPVSIDVAQQVWYCNDHKIGGSVIDWVMHERGCDVGEAIRSFNSSSDGNSKQEFVCAYDYTDEDGKPLFQTVRYKVPPPKKKTFSQRRPDGNGGWIKNLKGVRRVLYRLPQVKAAEVVIDVEGEKDADLLVALGFVATTNPMGAGKWLPEYSETLRGKIVVVFGDIGDPDKSGEKQTQEVLRSLVGKAKSLKHAIQPKDFHDVGEWIQYLRQAHPGEERQIIQQLIDETSEFEEVLPGVVFSHEQLMAFDPRHDPTNLLGNRWMCRGFTSLLAGPAGAGKSTLHRQMEIYWACGQSFCGIRPVRPLKILIVQAENDLGDSSEPYQGVIEAIRKHSEFEFDEQTVARNIKIVWLPGVSGEDFCRQLEQWIRVYRPDIVEIDPLFSFAGCDLMESRQTSRFLRELLYPIAIRNCLGMFVVHHVSKSYRDNEAKQGWSDLEFQYLGFGTSEIQNAFRAVSILLPVSSDGEDSGLCYRLVLSKRGLRAGARDPAGKHCTNLYLKQAQNGIFWTQIDRPDEKKKGGRPSKYDKQIILDEMSVVVGRSALEIRERTLIPERAFFRVWSALKKEELIRCDEEEKWYLKP